MDNLIICVYTQKKMKQAVPSSVEVEVWGLVKALSLIFENDNVEEVWSQRSLRLKKLLDEKVWSWGSFRWWSLKLKKFQVNKVRNWRTKQIETVIFPTPKLLVYISRSEKLFDPIHTLHNSLILNFSYNKCLQLQSSSTSKFFNVKLH